MTDINFSGMAAKPDSQGDDHGLAAGGRDLRWDIIELLFFAYRDFVGDADQELEAFGFGRAHHRVIHFVTRYPGLKVADQIVRVEGQAVRGLSLEGFEGWLHEIARRETVTVLPSTVFFPLHRVERIFMDETSGDFVSFADRFKRTVGEDARYYLTPLPDDLGA